MGHRLRYVFLVMSLIALGLPSAAAGGNREDRPAATEESTPIPVPDSPAADEPDAESSTDVVSSDTDEGGSEQSAETERLPQVIPLDEAAWILFFHEFGEAMTDEINVTLERGYVPAAVEITSDGALAVLYLYSPQTAPDVWLLEDYDDPSLINEAITTRLVNNWIPLGFSVLDGTYYVFYAHAEEQTIRGWRIHESEVDDEAITEVLALYQNQGFGLVDMSIDPLTDRMWYLFVEQPGAFAGPGARFFINAYPNGQTTAGGILSDYNAGRGFPFAFASGDVVSIVTFVRPAQSE